MKTEKLAVVVGGSRGLGRGVVEAFVAKGHRVIAVARNEVDLGAARFVRGDATDPALAEELLGQRPDIVVLAAGAMPVVGAFHELSWEDFSTNWNVDTRSAFVWLGRALRQPVGHFIVVASGAALQGSPASGGYASAKRAQWYLADYAATEAKRAEVPMIVHCVLPHLNASTPLGRSGIEIYARRAGIPYESFVKRFDPPLTPVIVGRSIVELTDTPERFPALAYKLGASGLADLGC